MIRMEIPIKAGGKERTELVFGKTREEVRKKASEIVKQLEEAGHKVLSAHVA